MSFPNWSRWHRKLWVAVAVAALVCAGVRMLPGAEPETKAASPGTAAAEPAQLSPVRSQVRWPSLAPSNSLVFPSCKPWQRYPRTILKPPRKLPSA